MKLPVFLNNKDVNANTAQFGMFVVYMFQYGMNKKDKGNQYVTIKGKVSAIRWYHRYYTGVVPELDEGYQLLMKGVRRMSKPTQKKHPLTSKMLRRLHGAINWQAPIQQLAWGTILLSYFFLLRRSEIFKVDGQWKPFVLRLGDAQFYDKNENVCDVQHASMVGIVLHGAKNNQYGRQEVRYQFKTNDPVLCPVVALAWARMAAKQFGTKPDMPLTSTGTNGRGIGNGQVVQTLKALARDMGLNPDDYSTHSMRIGGATALINSGAQSLVIKLLGRWMSNCFETYPVLLAAGSKGISSMMC